MAHDFYVLFNVIFRTSLKNFRLIWFCSIAYLFHIPIRICCQLNCLNMNKRFITIWSKLILASKEWNTLFRTNKIRLNWEKNYLNYYYNNGISEVDRMLKMENKNLQLICKVIHSGARDLQCFDFHSASDFSLPSSSALVFSLSSVVSSFRFHSQTVDCCCCIDNIDVKQKQMQNMPTQNVFKWVQMGRFVGIVSMCTVVQAVCVCVCAQARIAPWLC